ncbi:hypothetical protein EV11_1260 [Prochlorococcus sp. SS52]|nr:hypothetical protein EV04_0466 [Prochlorococcus marinus str. LG]KGG19114.1 hypothetical protein EV08_1601 [Prochlorococcus marinus str. SS2]KGG23346.1 hypothetical protein EV09_0970 [Prochlorococcus marinus str. SS35]KGG32418.1 hypothetical protein EV10_1533 [Prochlorococcus marinus str. SS51]KGG35696.1 hypothetical protein EV11_1260 [Prochlorococcus sp. SS52]
MNEKFLNQHLFCLIQISWVMKPPKITHLVSMTFLLGFKQVLAVK